MTIRRGDAEARERHRRAHLPGAAESLRIEILAGLELARAAVGAPSTSSKRLPSPSVADHQVVVVEVAAVGHRLEAGALEPRPDVVSRDAVLVGVGQPAAHRVAGEEEQVGAQVGLRDRLDHRRPLLRRQA